MLAGQGVVAARRFQRFCPAPALLAHRFVNGNAALGGGLAGGAGGVVLAAQEAKTQRRISQQGHAQAVHGFVQPVVHRAVEQAVRVLHRGHARQAVLLGQTHKLMHAVRRLVGQTDGAHLAVLDQAAQGFELVVDGGDRHVFGRVEIHDAEGRHMAHRPVDLIQVNHVGLQALETGVAGFGDVRRGQVVAAAAHPAHAACRAGHFGGQHQLLARARIFFKPVAQDFFGEVEGFSACGHRVHLCGVEKVDAARQRVVQDGVRRGLVNLFAKSHGAQADRGHLEIAGAEFDFFHGVGWVVYGTVVVNTTAA